MIGKALVVLFIPFKLLFLVAFNRARYSLVVAVFTKIAGDDKKIRALLYLLAVYRVKIAFAKRKVMYGVKQVGFARAVIPGKNINAIAKC